MLVVDDDVSLLRAMRLGLESLGHEVITAATGEQGIAQTALTFPDVVILDIGLPDTNGLAVCKTIREWSDVPIIVLSATGTENRKIAALNGGANDYVTKPFSMGELEARIRAVTRRGRLDDQLVPETISIGSIELDQIHREVRVNDRLVPMTAKEFDVLSYMGQHRGRTCTHQMILSAVWGPGYGEEAQYVHAYVHRLRHKLNDESGDIIVTLPGVGYVLRDNADPSNSP